MKGCRLKVCSMAAVFLRSRIFRTGVRLASFPCRLYLTVVYRFAAGAKAKHMRRLPVRLSQQPDSQPAGYFAYIQMQNHPWQSSRAGMRDRRPRRE